MNIANIKSYGEQIASPNDLATYQRYLKEVSKYKPLTREQEVEVFKRIKATNNQKDIDLICHSNLRFVVSVAKIYSKMLGRTTLSLEDLINEGNLGMCLAVQRFDYTLGYKFITYAVAWIRQSILGCISSNIKNIRLPSHVIVALTKLKKKEAYLEQQLGRDVSSIELYEAIINDEISPQLDSVDKVEEWFKMNIVEASLSNKPRSESEVTFEDLLKDDNSNPYDKLVEKERGQLARKMLNSLPTMIRQYFNDYYGFDGNTPMSYKEMSIKYDEIPATIKARMDKYLHKMRRSNKKDKLFYFPTPDYELSKEYRNNGWSRDTLVLR
jgi:RNA polymerase primary sigma factor